MKPKKIALVSALFLTCNLAVAATYTPEAATNLNTQFNTKTNNNSLKNKSHNIVKLIKDGQLDLAKTKIKELIQQNPKEASLYNLQGSLQLLQKNHTESIKSYQQAVTLEPKNFRHLLGLATTYLQIDNLGQAQKYALKASTINPASAPAYILLAKVAYKQNKPQDSEKLLLTAYNKASKNRQQQILIATELSKLYLALEQPQKALKTAESLANKYPNSSAALEILATTQIYNKLSTDAINTLKRLVKQEDKNIQHRLLLAQLLLKQPQSKQEILKLLDEVKLIAPNSPEVQAKRIIILSNLKLYPEALQAIKRLKQLSPDTGVAEALEGGIYLETKKTQAALVAFKESYHLSPKPKVLVAITQIMSSQGNTTEAQTFILQELKKDPKNLTARFILAQTYQQQNNIAEAEKHYKIILETNPDNLLALNNLAWIYHEQNNPKGLELIEKAYKKAPKSASITDTYATILIAKGENKKGITLFEKAVALAPNNGEIQFHLAQAYVGNGQIQQAIQVLNTISKFEQDFPQKQDAIELLGTLQ